MRIKTNDKYISIILKNQYETIKNEIVLSATLNCVYTEKMSNEIINTKMNNQLNAMEVSINRINPKFMEKSKNYEKIKEQMIKTLDDYEKALKQFCTIFDQKTEDLIYKKTELESKLLLAIITNQKEAEKNNENRKYVVKLQKEIKDLEKRIKKLEQSKKTKVFEAMEVGDGKLSTEIKKPRNFRKITRFFMNRFNSHKIIMQTIIEPMNQRIDEFKINELKKIEEEKKEFNLPEIEEKIKLAQNNILNDVKNKVLLKKLGILEKY